jgi:outer membrane lipoprotein-sorting protein
MTSHPLARSRITRAIVLPALVAVAAVWTHTGTANAEGDPSGLEIVTKADDARRAKSERQMLTMTLENSRGQKRVRTIEGWEREMSDAEEQRFSRFQEPADVKDTTLLTYDYEDKDDDIWLYLPALKKVKRILSSNKGDYFMGSDFTYEDMENIDLVNWTYTVAGKETIAGTECWIVDAVANTDKERSETSYNKLRYWIGADDFIIRKIDYTDKKDRQSKQLIISEIRTTSATDPRKRGHKMEMKNFLTEHRTVLDISELQLDVPVSDDLFSQRNLQP